LAVDVLEDDPLPGEDIDRRRAAPRVAVNRQVVGAQGVDRHEHDRRVGKRPGPPRSPAGRDEQGDPQDAGASPQAPLRTPARPRVMSRASRAGAATFKYASRYG